MGSEANRTLLTELGNSLRNKVLGAHACSLEVERFQRGETERESRAQREVRQQVHTNDRYTGIYGNLKELEITKPQSAVPHFVHSGAKLFTCVTR